MIWPKRERKLQPGAKLDEKLQALADFTQLATDLGGSWQPAPGELRQNLELWSQRAQHSSPLCLVALAGGTGCGKSTLFNALSGTSAAATGVRRPTTAEAMAAFNAVSAARPELSDMLRDLGVRNQVLAPSGEYPQGLPDNLVLLDLPDIDSDRGAHHEITRHLIARVDVLVWVSDIQKYADSTWHEGYLGQLAASAATTFVALTHCDLLSQSGREEVTAHLQGLLAERGLGAVPIYPVDPRDLNSPFPPAKLAADLSALVSSQTARYQRLDDELRHLGQRLENGYELGQSSGEQAEEDMEPLVEVATQAIGGPALAQAVESSYRHRAVAKVGWPLTRPLRALRRDALARWHLSEPAGQASAGEEPFGEEKAREAHLQAGVAGGEEAAILDLPNLRPAQGSSNGVNRASLENAARKYVSGRLAGLSPNWQAWIWQVAAARLPAVERALSLCLHRVEGARLALPAWWRVWNWVHWVLLVAALVGGAWLGLAHAAQWTFSQIPMVMVGPISLPALLVAIGLGGALAWAACGRAWAASRARRRRQEVEAQIRREVRRALEDSFSAEVARAEGSYLELSAQAAILRQ